MGDMTGVSPSHNAKDYASASQALGAAFGPGGCFPRPFPSSFPSPSAYGLTDKLRADEILSIKECDNGYIVRAAEHDFEDEEFGLSPFPADKTYVFDSENKLAAWVSKFIRSLKKPATAETD